MQKTVKKNKKFEEEYFQGWYKHAVGNFTQADLKYSRNWFWAWLRKLNEFIPVEKGYGRSVLEIGCSIGGVASLLSDRGFKVFGSDISEYAVKNAKLLNPKANFLSFDVQHEIPLKQKFDIIIAFEVVEHLENPEGAIKNMISSLKKDGFLVISTPYPYPWNYRDKTHINLKYPSEWIKIMRKNKLKKIKKSGFTLLPFFYKLHPRLQIILPFISPIPFINSPIFFIGQR